jgi:5-methylcytosine-specific restriction protein B
MASEGESPADALLALSILALEQLNTKIRDAPELGRGKQLGHSYLLGVDRDAPTDTQIQDLLDRWEFEMLPLLEEYYFGQFDEIEMTLFDGDAGPLLDADRQEIGSFSAEELATVLGELANVEGVEWTWTPTTDVSDGSDEREASDTFGPDTVYTMEYLFELGMIEPGDELEFNRERLPEGTDPQFGPESDYWRCTLTGNSGQQNGVRWNHNGDLYSISGLTGEIHADLTGRERESFTGPQWWRHPSHLEHSLYSLKEAIENGEIQVEYQPADDD